MDDRRCGSPSSIVHCPSSTLAAGDSCVRYRQPYCRPPCRLRAGLDAGSAKLHGRCTGRQLWPHRLYRPSDNSRSWSAVDRCATQQPCVSAPPSLRASPDHGGDSARRAGKCACQLGRSLYTIFTRTHRIPVFDLPQAMAFVVLLCLASPSVSNWPLQATSFGREGDTHVRYPYSHG